MNGESKVTVDLSKHPKQLEYYLEVMKACNGKTSKRKFIYGGGIRSGKAIDINSNIPTPTGWAKMADLKEGDYIIGADGNPDRVYFASEIQYGNPCYEVHFSDGSVIIADAEHQWVTQTHAERKNEARRTDDFRIKRRGERQTRGKGVRPDLAALNTITNRPVGAKAKIPVRTTIDILNTIDKNHSIQLSKPFDLPHAELPIHPYILGVWIGDGFSGQGKFAKNINDATHIKNKANSLGFQTHDWIDSDGLMNVKFEGLYRMLRENSLLNNKNIPPQYLRASFEQRLQLLQGIMDTDGFISNSGKCEISLKKEHLIKSVSELIRSLGIKCNYNKINAKCNGKIFPNFRITFNTDLPIATIPRKANNIKAKYKQRPYYITKIVPCESVPVKCISVEREMYLVGDAMIPTHNTFITLFIITQLCEKYPRSRWLVVRESFPSIQKTTIESFHKIIAGSDNWNWRLDRGNYYAENKKGSRVYFMAENIAQDPRLNAFLGIEMNGIFLEQLEELSKEVWDMSISRSGSWYIDPMPPAFIFTTLNPTQKWPKPFLYERWRNDTLPDDFFFMPALPSDNPFVTEDQRNAWTTMDDRMRKTLVEGDWTDFDDTDPRWAFAFNKERHVKPVIPFLPSFPVYLGWDFNRDPLSCVAAQFSPNIGHRGSFLHWIKEFSEPVQLRELCIMIRAAFPRSIFYVTGDSSGNKGDIGYDRKNDTHYRMIQRYLNLPDKQMNLNKQNMEHADSRLLVNTMLSSYPNEFFAEKLQMPDGTIVNGVPRLIDEHSTCRVDSSHHMPGRLLKDRSGYKLDLFDGSRYLRQTYFKKWLDFVGYTIAKR